MAPAPKQATRTSARPSPSYDPPALQVPQSSRPVSFLKGKETDGGRNQREDTRKGEQIHPRRLVTSHLSHAHRVKSPNPPCQSLPTIPHIVGSLLLASSQSPAVNSSITGDSRPATTSAPYAIRHSWQGGKEGERKRAVVGVKVCKRQKRFTSCVARNFERLLL